MPNHKSFVIWHMETLLIPCGDSERIHDVLKYIREKVRVQFHNLTDPRMVLFCLILATTLIIGGPAQEKFCTHAHFDYDIFV